MRPPVHEGDLELAAVVGAEWPGLVFDAAAAQAARAYAALSVQRDGTILPSADLRQILSDAGLPESTASCSIVTTTEGGFDDVLDHLEDVVDPGGGVTHIGLARAPAQRAPFKWLWAVLLIERRIDLVHPVPRQMALAGAIPLRFRLQPGWHRPRVLVQYPSGITWRMRPAEQAGVWFTVVPAGRLAGRLTLQILAEGPPGPRVAAQMPIRVGFAGASGQSSEPTATFAADESAITTSRAAEAFLFEVVNSARTDHGLAPLEWDAELADVARAHSSDMLVNGFFGHVSPTHGDMQLRLREAGLMTSVARENVARDTSLTHAHGSLMASPGHQSNVLADDVDRVGIGVVADHQPGMRLHWVVTEIFVRPYAAPSPAAVLAKRESSQPAPCRRDPALDQLATWFVSAAPATGEVDAATYDELKRRLEETGIAWAKMSNEIAVIHSLDDVDRVLTVDQSKYSTCGMAARTVADEDGRDAVLLAVVLVEPR